MITGATKSADPILPQLGYHVLLRLFVGVVSVGLAAGLLSYHYEKFQSRDEKSRLLETIADLKTQQVGAWLDERRNDADIIQHDEHLIRLVTQWLDAGAPDNDVGQAIIIEMQSLLLTNQYHSVTLLDAAMATRAKVGVAPPIYDNAARDKAELAANTGVIRLYELNPSARRLDRDADLTLFTPLRISNPKTTRVVGVLGLNVDTGRALVPLLNSGPLPGGTDRVLLVHRRGKQFIAVQRAQRNAGSDGVVFTSSGDKTTQVNEGIDERGTPVLAVMRDIPGTNWTLLAELDRSEVSHAAESAARYSALLALLLASLAAVWWYRQRKAFVHASLQATLERETLTQQLDYLGRYANDAILLIDAADHIVASNTKALDLYGYAREELINQSIEKLHAHQARNDVAAQWANVNPQQASLFETLHQSRAGKIFPVEISAHNILVQDKQFRQAIIRDISERKRAESDIIRARDFYLALLDIIPNPIWHAGSDAKYDYFNQAWLAFTGRELAQEIGNGWTENVHADDLEQCIDTYLSAFNARRPFTVEYRLRHHDGSYHWISDHGKPFFDLDGNFAGYIGSCYDLQQIKSAEARLEFLANHDTLTRLPNRLLLHDRIERALARAHRDARHVAVLFVDLDRFKVVNDSLGHTLGDRLLLAFAERLHNCVRDADTVGRLGGDEFVIVIPDLREANDAVAIAQKILDAMAVDFQLGEHHVHITPSIGISAFPQDGQDASMLIKNADAAMYAAKECGRNNIQFYSPALYVSAHERINMEYGMLHALEQGEFELFYQPQVDVRTRTIVGLEALLRWRHPDKGLLLPGRFLAIAEDSGLILPIGRWVLNTACKQCHAWQDAGIATIPVCVNLTALQFRDKSLAADIASALRESGLPAMQLHLGITKDILVQFAGESSDVLRTLFELGIRLTIDDCAGGQQLSDTLHHEAIHTLMLDRQYVRNIAHDSDDETVIRNILNVARSRNLRVIAEGVETDAQLTLLSKRGCDTMQGFFFSEALPAAHMTELLRTGLKGGAATVH